MIGYLIAGAVGWLIGNSKNHDAYMREQEQARHMIEQQNRFIEQKRAEKVAAMTTDEKVDYLLKLTIGG